MLKITCFAGTPSLFPATNIHGTVLGSFCEQRQNTKDNVDRGFYRKRTNYVGTADRAASLLPKFAMKLGFRKQDCFAFATSTVLRLILTGASWKQNQQSWHYGYPCSFDVQSSLSIYEFSFITLLCMAKIGRDWNNENFTLNISRLAHVFPRFPSAACIWSEFWLVHCFACVLCDWLEKSLYFGLTTLNWKPLYDIV